jgi:hypothetical protein
VKKYSSLAAAAVMITSASAAQAATMQLSLQYIGSTTATSQTGLTIQNLSNPAVENSSWRHYFEVFASFTPAPSSSEAFRNMINNIDFSSNITPTTKNGTINNTTNKWFPINPTDTNSGLSVFTASSDGGTFAGDLQALFTHQDSDDSAQAQQYGTAAFAEGGTPSPLGVFATEMLAPLTQDATITVSEGPGQSFSFFNAADSNDQNFTTEAGGISPATFTIPGTPEPASVGLLALGGLALLARRRRAL